MITEHAVLPVIPGRETEFMETMDRARAIIASAPGFISLRVGRCIEQPANFLLLVEWETLEAHTEGFRGSSDLSGVWNL
jgi:heme-degrading monooxygenase HmoA